jgi:hypothetical protein
MGLAVGKPFDIKDNYAIIYYPPRPRALLEVVDPGRADAPGRYGETGRVRLTTLTKRVLHAAFSSSAMKRSASRRATPIPWDGVRNVRPFSRSFRGSGQRRESTNPHIALDVCYPHGYIHCGYDARSQTLLPLPTRPFTS